ncbi:MAG: type III secretion system translocon subunit SctE [Chlamydiales bacterium]|nr:type III secretion system translocon subunit SctE [Chlamydiales bacterium]
MSFGVQTTYPTAAFGELAAGEGEETQQAQSDIDLSIPEPKGDMRSAQKTYTLSLRSETPESPQLRAYISNTGAKNSIKLNNSPMQLASTTYGHSASAPSNPTGKVLSQPFSMPQTSGKTASTQNAFTNGADQAQTGKFQIITAPAAPKGVLPQEPLLPRNEVRRNVERSVNKTTDAQNRSVERREGRTQSPSLQSRTWTKEETSQWWEQRYHQKERDGQKQGQREEQEQQEQHPDKKKKKSVAGVSALWPNKKLPRIPQNQPEGGAEKIMKKPTLKKPQTGIFALYYILTKIGILSDGTSNFSYKKEIETIDAETTQAYKKRLGEMKEAIEKEKEAEQWGIATKVFSWMGALISIVAGVALIATGVGAVAGAMMIAGGIIQLTNQILEITGGWKKIAELLPGDDPEKKRAVINWIQIGIAVLCLILSGVGVIWGGYANFGEAMQTAMALFGGIAAMGHGATTIGGGITSFMYKERMSEVRRYEKILAELKHKRRDLMERVDWGVDRLEQLFEDLAKTLEFEVELFRADQMVNR